MKLAQQMLVAAAAHMSDRIRSLARRRERVECVRAKGVRYKKDEGWN